MIEFYIYYILGNWQILAMVGTALLLFYSIFAKDYYEKMWTWFKWEKKWILLAAAGIIVIQIREIIVYPFIWIQVALPSYSAAAQIFFYLGNIHVRSLFFYAIMIFWLWRKFGYLLPALVTGWFWLGLIELTFIPQHFLWLDGFFLGISYYLPFIMIMVLWILERKRFVIPRKAWIWFSAAVFVQYAGLLFTPWAVVQLFENGFTINPAALPEPHIFTYAFDFLQHLMKTLFAIAACYIGLKKTDGDN